MTQTSTRKAARITSNDGSFELRVRLYADLARWNQKSEWSWAIYRDGKRFAHGRELHGWGDADEMLRALAGFLSADGESYNYFFPHDPRDGWIFTRRIAAWAAEVSDELSLMGIDDPEDEEN